MRTGPSRSSLLVLLALASCGVQRGPPNLQSPLHTVRFDLYSEARAFRADVEDEGRKASRIGFDSGTWAFSTDTPLTNVAIPTFASEECSTRATGEAQGITSCPLYSATTRERRAMAEGDWVCSGITFDPQARRFEFGWRRG